MTLWPIMFAHFYLYDGDLSRNVGGLLEKILVFLRLRTRYTEALRNSLVYNRLRVSKDVALFVQIHGESRVSEFSMGSYTVS